MTTIDLIAALEQERDKYSKWLSKIDHGRKDIENTLGYSVSIRTRERVMFHANRILDERKRELEREFDVSVRTILNKYHEGGAR